MELSNADDLNVKLSLSTLQLLNVIILWEGHIKGEVITSLVANQSIDESRDHTRSVDIELIVFGAALIESHTILGAGEIDDSLLVLVLGDH